MGKPVCMCELLFQILLYIMTGAHEGKERTSRIIQK